MADCLSPSCVEDLKDFFSKCSKAMLGKLGISELEFSAIVYLKISEKQRLFSSFDRELNSITDKLHL